MDADILAVYGRLAKTFSSVAHDAQGEPVAGANTSVLHETKSQIQFPSLCTSDLNQYLKASLTNGSTA